MNRAFSFLFRRYTLSLKTFYGRLFSGGGPSFGIQGMVTKRPYTEKREQKIKDKNKSFGLYLFAGIAGMVGLSYAFVPLYRMFCQVTGFGGTTQVSQSGKNHSINTSKEFTINFTGQSSAQLPWKFSPSHKSVDVYPGETVLAFYEATNTSDEPLIGIATYGVYPPQAGKYFEKIECFCFDEQRIGPKETVTMPVLFTLNPDILKSTPMQDVYDITLHYTFFLSTDQNIYWDDSELESPAEPLPEPPTTTHSKVLV